MEIFNKNNSRHTGSLEILTSHLLISPHSSSARNLSLQISSVPVGSEQPVHAHAPEQCYYIIRGTGLMRIEDETQEVTAGDAVFIPADRKHGLRNIGDTVLKYLTANAPAFTRAYEDSHWTTAPG